MGVGGVVGEEVEAGLEKAGPGEGVENGDNIDSDGGTLMGEAVMGAGGVVDGGVEAGLEKTGPGEGVATSDGGTWMGEVVGASVVVVGAAVGDPFLFPAGPGGPFLLPWRPGASVFTGLRGTKPFLTF